MALTKQQKQDIVEEVSQLLDNSKLTVVAKYQGTTVKSIQELRKSAKDNHTTVKVFKNRLVIKAINSSERLASIDTSGLNGQLMYAFNSEDEVAPAQALANFAKTNTNIEFVGAITSDGQFIGSDDVKALASLPSKDQLRAQLVGTIAAPISGFVNVLNGNLRGVLNALNARADQLG